MNARKSPQPPQQPTVPGTPRSADSTPDPQEIEEVRERVEKEIGPLVPGSARRQVVERVTQIIVREEEQFVGPIPHPRHLEQYEAACPGAADRLIAMAEKVNDAQIELIKNGQRNEHSDRALGQQFGLFSLMAILAATVALGIFGKPILASGVLGMGAVGVIARFINGRQHQLPKSDDS